MAARQWTNGGLGRREVWLVGSLASTAAMTAEEQHPSIRHNRERSRAWMPLRLRRLSRLDSPCVAQVRPSTGPPYARRAADRVGRLTGACSGSWATNAAGLESGVVLSRVMSMNNCGPTRCRQYIAAEWRYEEEHIIQTRCRNVMKWRRCV